MQRCLVFSLVLLIAVLTTSCRSSAQPRPEKEISTAPPDVSNGLNLLEKNCFSCHSPRGGHDGRIAPPMAAIKRHYIDEDTSLEEFSRDLRSFVENPSLNNARMKGAIEKFGLMPRMEFDESELRDIAAYIYTTELEKPHGFGKRHAGANKSPEKKPHSPEVDYLEQGRNFAMQAGAHLGSNLVAAVKEKGAAGAVSFCNHEAIPLTDSMAIALQARIKRVSDQPRNPDNQANEQELEYIQAAKQQLAKGEPIDPQLTDLGNTILGYYPITTNAMCLQCHGAPRREIEQATLDVLHELYPDDKAQGYGANELRGIWVVEMDK